MQSHGVSEEMVQEVMNNLHHRPVAPRASRRWCKTPVHRWPLRPRQGAIEILLLGHSPFGSSLLPLGTAPSVCSISRRLSAMHMSWPCHPDQVSDRLDAGSRGLPLTVGRRPAGREVLFPERFSPVGHGARHGLGGIVGAEPQVRSSFYLLRVSCLLTATYATSRRNDRRSASG